MKLLHLLALIAVTTIGFSTNSYATDEHWALEVRKPYNAMIQSSQTLNFKPLQQASKPWKICALVPHLKDAYWIGIDYGLMTHAKALNVTVDLFEANSYYGRKRQLEQLDHCVNSDYDAILLGAVGPNILEHYGHPIHKKVIALVNMINAPEVYTRVGVNWYSLGVIIGEHLKNEYPEPGNLALLMGPYKVGGSARIEQGIHKALKNSQYRISSIRHADNNRNLHRKQLLQLLEQQTPDYIIGGAVAIEAAVSVLRQKGLSDEVKLLSSYFSPALWRALYRNKVIYSNDDRVVLQGKLAIDITVRELEGEPAFGDIGPIINRLTNNPPAQDQLKDSLAPAEFYPVYSVLAENK
ncbi:TMAO reductase system periplasmic protein TorT [Shewanella gelidii]|uniref:TMAO reductase system periplasmic protein TorT n=1 Tax=Shewanella gelidii TaxID=1642821 RepID=A0A917JMC7_9GAMM|nr:TMAO reductase system periplasmic protein TorT [Shewanella gelidii]MCL1097167.1 TMAO reductase system periplasmic protein TorT [Shewanella gelidii]GGI72995.1 TMAO reductase system periplasmic protein TorT [Shewanella gelidii]